LALESDSRVNETVEKVAVLVEEMYEDLELWYPLIRLKEAGYQPVIIGSGTKEVYLSKHGYPAKAAMAADKAIPDEYVAVIIPGGFAPDHMRRHPPMVDFVKKMYSKQKLVAGICHAGSMLVSANILKGKKATSFYSVKDDVINAGARWFDEEVVVDGNLITSRNPEDLPAFMKAILGQLGSR
jgi:protease I